MDMYAYPTAILLLYFTGSKRYKISASNPNHPPRRLKRQSANTLDYDEGAGTHVQRSVSRQREKDRLRAEKEKDKFIQQQNEQAQRFEDLETLEGMTKEEFRAMRKQDFYSLERTSSNGDYWRHEQELIQKEIYDTLNKHPVCPQGVLNFASLGKKKYFEEAIWVAKKMGLEHLMTNVQQNYSIPLVQQFFATVVLHHDEERSMTWMTGPTICTATFTEFAGLLGYDFQGAETPVGKRVHIFGSEYNKNKLAPLYGMDGVIGKNRGFHPLYNILIRMFRENIAPQAGNLDDIRSALVNLMYHAHKTYLAGPDCQGYEIDVMDFIHCEIHQALLEQKNPIYAPYVMKLILYKMEDLNTSHYTVHKVKNLQVLHGKDKAKGPFASSDDGEAPPRASRGARRKNVAPSGDLSPPSPPTKEKIRQLNWFQRTLLCMQTTIHKENHDAYIERKRIIHNQGVIMKEINELRGKQKAPKVDDESSSEESGKTITYSKWNCNSVDWAAFSEVTSQPSTSNVEKGKGPAESESEYEDQDEDESEEDSA